MKLACDPVVAWAMGWEMMVLPIAKPLGPVAAARLNLVGLSDRRCVVAGYFCAYVALVSPH